MSSTKLPRPVIKRWSSTRLTGWPMPNLLTGTSIVRTSTSPVFGNDLGPDREEPGIFRIDHHAHPMRIRIAEHLEPREMIEEASALAIHQRLADVEDVGVAMDEQRWLVVARHLG